MMVVALAVMMMGMTINVMADETTELSSMTVYAVDDTGAKTKVPMEFNQTTFTYEITVMSNVTEIEIEAEVADSTSTWAIEKDGINTKMDPGRNYTAVAVTSASGATGKYEINTTRLTAEEEATYVAPEGSEPEQTTPEGEETVKVGKKEYTIASTINKSDIPEGFVEDVATYNDEEYPCIKGEKKELTAFYLFNEDTNGFFIYDGEDFYKMNNIQIKSRMYTVVNPAETEKFLDTYEKKNVTIIDKEVKAWVLDAEEGMYLVYAMNWNGDTNLYCYDDEEKCFQRYLTSANADSQISAANTAYENQVKKYNSLVDKYNLIVKILCGLAVIIVILIFVIINLKINKKAKKLAAKAQAEEELPEEYEEDNELEVSKRSLFSGNTVSRPYGDEVTFGTENEDSEGFYGGEIKEEDEIFIDILDDEEEDIKIDDVEVKSEVSEDIQLEENLKEALKSILPEENSTDDVEEEDDFEFIDLD